MSHAPGTSMNVEKLIDENLSLTAKISQVFDNRDDQRSMP